MTKIKNSKQYDLEDIDKISWSKGDEWFEKWYSTEFCFRALNKGANPLYDIFTKEGINSIALNTQWFHESGSYDRWYQDLDKALAEDRVKILSKVVSESEKLIKKTEKIIGEIKEINILDRTVFDKVKNGLNSLWFVFLIDLGKSLGPFIDRELKNNGLSKDQIEILKNYYFLIKEKLMPQKEAEALKRIALYYKREYKDKTFNFNNLPSDINKLLIKHWEKFRCLSCQDIDTNPYSIEDYYNNLKELLTIKRREKRRLVVLGTKIKGLLTKVDIEFLGLINKHLFLDNYAADLWARLDFQFMWLLSQKFGISFKELSWYSFQELELLIRRGTRLSGDQLGERKKYSVMVQINGELNCFYGKENFEKISSLVWANIKQEDLSEFTGIVACKGEARGVVRIVKGVKDINKVSEGDILVSTTTRPDLMMAILRCSAIITDSGGITSHAAIVSREFGIPCIVGTKVATQILKDGDIVEVDANKGIVRKIA